MKLRNKVVAAASATAMTAGMVMSSVPVFAGSEEMDFINSYNGIVRQVAQYVIDEGCTLEEAQELVDNFIKGEEELQEEANGGISAYADISDEIPDEELGDYYSREDYASSKHYVAVISVKPNITLKRLNLYLNGVNNTAVISGEGSCRACFDYSSMISIEDNLNSKNGFWNYTITTTGVGSIENSEAKTLLIFPIEKGNLTSNEYELKKDIEFSYMASEDESEFVFETFAMGDLNHNGKVTYADTNILMKYMMGKELDLIYRDGSNHYSKAVLKVSADVNQDNAIGLSDLQLINKFIGGSYEM